MGGLICLVATIMIWFLAFCYGYSRGLDELRSSHGWGQGFDSGWDEGWKNGWNRGYVRGMESNGKTTEEIEKLKEADAKWGKGGDGLTAEEAETLERILLKLKNYLTGDTENRE